MMNIYSKEEVLELFSKLFDECKHGDTDHQIWLRDKIKDFTTNHVGEGIVFLDLNKSQ